MARPRNYTDEQLAYIKQHWRKYPTKLVAEQLGMTVRRVDTIAYNHGLIKNRNKSRKPLLEFVTLDNLYNPHGEFHTATFAHVPNPQPSDYIHSGRPECHEPQQGVLSSLGSIAAMNAQRNVDFSGRFVDPLPPSPPRKNWLQRLVSWLLTGEA